MRHRFILTSCLDTEIHHIWEKFPAFPAYDELDSSTLHLLSKSLNCVGQWIKCLSGHSCFSRDRRCSPRTAHCHYRKWNTKMSESTSALAPCRQCRGSLLRPVSTSLSKVPELLHASQKKNTKLMLVVSVEVGFMWETGWNRFTMLYSDFAYDNNITALIVSWYQH